VVALFFRFLGAPSCHRGAGRAGTVATIEIEA